MILDTPFYNKHTKNNIIAFGRLFSDMKIIREHKDDPSKNQALRVPISYAPKEKWIVRIDQDPELNNHVYTVLPVMSFDITSFTYDPSRKLNRMNKVAGSSSFVYTGVPYDLDLSLYIVTKTQEDNFQILEQILPLFTPEFTIKYNANTNPLLKEDLPIILNSVQIEDNYDGDFKDRRFVTSTLSFTLKINVYGASTSLVGGVITNPIVNLHIKNPGDTVASYHIDAWTENI